MTGIETRGERAANALGVPDFRRLWLNNVAFFLVANAQRFAFGWIVLDLLLRNERSQGLIVFALGVPTLFLVLHAGMWADRWNRKRLLIGTQLAAASVMAATAVLIGLGRIGPGREAAESLLAGEGGVTAEAADNGFGWLLLLTALAGAATALGQPVRTALVPVLVPREQLFSAIAVNAIAMTLSMILGPVLLKVVGDEFGFDGAFWFLTALLLLGTVALARLRVPDHAEPTERRPGLREVGDAVRHIIRDRRLRTLFGLLGLSSITVNPAVMVTLQAHVKEELGRSAGDAAIPFSLMGIGMAISSVYVMRRGDMPNKGANFMRAMMFGSTMTMSVGLSGSFELTLLFAFSMGLAGGFFINMNQGLIQAHTPEPIMGRVMAVYTLMMNGLMPLGALVLGLVAGAIGTGPTIAIAGATSLSIVALTYLRDEELGSLS
ncbi:MAG: MFS transporter [Actinomycetota bacterium]